LWQKTAHQFETFAGMHDDSPINLSRDAPSDDG
jgi:hypothetical protein